jgi:hypothetical protein
VWYVFFGPVIVSRWGFPSYSKNQNYYLHQYCPLSIPKAPSSRQIKSKSKTKSQSKNYRCIKCGNVKDNLKKKGAVASDCRTWLNKWSPDRNPEIVWLNRKVNNEWENRLLIVNERKIERKMLTAFCRFLSNPVRIVYKTHVIEWYLRLDTFS